MNKSTRIAYTCISTAALLALGLFALWWFRIEHIPNNFSGIFRIFDILLFLILSYIIWHPLLMEVLAWAITSHIRKIVYIKPKPGLKVAFVTTYVPGSETPELLHKTLPAMVAVDYEHDTWVLDEGDDPEAKEICRLYGVKHFSRYGMDMYNQPEGKYARKTKGGNHNSWYDSYGNDYDFVAQMDTDFIPHKDFLTKTLGFFDDPKVAFVGTPQVYGNGKDSIIAQGAAEQTYNFYGPILRGLDGMDTTLLIGANHVIRVAALKSVNHYSAHITEDLLTGMKLHAHGWKSVYVPEALAIGEGPVTWKSYFSQQKRWAYGCMHILYKHSPKLLREMKFRRTIYYFLIQQHYFSGLAMILSVVCLSLYFAFGFLTADMELLPFLQFYIPAIVVTYLMGLWLQQFNIRPKQERGIMWAGMYIGVAVWPIFFLAFVALFKRKKLEYKVTPKGRRLKKRAAPSISLFAPHLVIGSIALVGFLSGLTTHRTSPLMQFWALLSAALMFLVPIIAPIAHRIRTFSRQSLSRFIKKNLQYVRWLLIG